MGRNLSLVIYQSVLWSSLLAHDILHSTHLLTYIRVSDKGAKRKSYLIKAIDRKVGQVLDPIHATHQLDHETRYGFRISDYLLFNA